MKSSTPGDRCPGRRRLGSRRSSPLRRSALFGAAGVAVLLLGGCGPQAASEGSTTTSSSPTWDPVSSQGRTLEILSDAYDRIQVTDKPSLTEQKWTGSRIACTLGGPDPALSWGEEARLRVADPQVQAERVRTWLDEQGFERIDMGSQGSATGHGQDGFIVLVSTWTDGRIAISVESPCFDADGNRLSR